jgi:protein MpaA
VFSAKFATAARRAGFQSEQFGDIGGHSLLAYHRSTAAGRPRIYLSAGIHGDEPAPPWALLRSLEDDVFSDRASWYVCPLLNPMGFVRGTRENETGVDLNRDYKTPRSPEVLAHTAWLRRQASFDLVICVHEDWEAQGFYLYELNPENRPTLAHAMIAGAREHGPIETATVIDGRESAEPAIIRPVADPLLRETWPEAIYLREHHGTLHYTIESPSGIPLEQRIAILRAAISAGLDAFLL